MPETDHVVECSTHGQSNAAYVCRHLVNEPRQAWFCDYPSGDNPWPDAWCGVCDQAFQKEGEWNEKNKNDLDITLICHRCYEDFKGSSVAPLMATRSDEWRPLISDAISELQAKQDRLTQQFDLFRRERWHWDQGTGEIVFSDTGDPVVVARIQFVGSVSALTNTWLWSWANPSYDPGVVTDMLSVRDFGETERFANLTVPKWPAEEADGWEMTAVAAKLLGADGAYRTPSDTGFSFMVLKDVRRAQ